MRALLSTIAFLFVASTALAQVAVAPPSARTALGLTVYDGFAVVRESRSLPGGSERSILWPEVPPSLDPGTVILRGDGRTLEIRRQAWEAPLSSGAALRSAVGSRVTLVGEDGSRIAAVLESADGPTFRVGDRLLVAWPGAVELPAPPDASAGGALRWELAAPAPSPLTAAFLADGLSWSADYTAVLGEDSMALDGFVTVENGTGLAFTGARLQLVAGEVRRVADGGAPRPVAMRMAEAAVGDDVSREAFGDVHLYTVDDPVTLSAVGSTRISLFHAPRVPVRREYVLYSQPWWFQSRAPDLPATEHPQVRLAFENRNVAGGDDPLPAGVLHTWRADDQGRLQFSGEAAIPHTPSGEEVVATIGAAFDIVAERAQTDYRQLDPRTFESAWRIEIRNRSRSAASVLVVERMPGFEWTIVEESRPHERIDAQVVRWTVPVPAGGSATLTYRVRVTQG
ncbi:MAG TPA: DUF4139 domain-containing protein [Gemmatimonadota bacterium]|nr:DUF4139 domain-containing protein [Gemmatimonadota bacterium]